MNFYLVDCLINAVYAIIFTARRVCIARTICRKMSVCLSVRPSVRLSQAGILSNGYKYPQSFLHNRLAPPFYTVSQKKNAPTLASCSFGKHGLILIIFGKRYQHTFENDMRRPIQLSLSLLFYLLSLRSPQREQLNASMVSICLFVCLSVSLSPKCKNAIFSKTKQFRAMVSIDDL